MACALQQELGNIAKSGDSAHFGTGERKKGNVDVEKILDVAVPCENDTSSLLVRYHAVGEPALVIDAPVAEDLEILGQMAAVRPGIIEAIDHAVALDRRPRAGGRSFPVCRR